MNDRVVSNEDSWPTESDTAIPPSQFEMDAEDAHGRLAASRPALVALRR